MVKHGNIHSGIPTPDKKPTIPLGNDYYSINKNPTDYFATSSRAETIRMHIKIISRVKTKRERIIFFIYWRLIKSGFN